MKIAALPEHLKIAAPWTAIVTLLNGMAAELRIARFLYASEIPDSGIVAGVGNLGTFTAVLECV